MTNSFGSDPIKPISEIEPMPPAPAEIITGQDQKLAFAQEWLEKSKVWIGKPAEWIKDHPRIQHIALATGKTAIAGALVLAPPAAAIDAAMLAPAASVPGTIAGAHATSKLDFASGDIISSFPFDIKPYQKSNIGPDFKPLGAKVNFDYNGTDLTDDKGHIDFQKIEAILKDFSEVGDNGAAIASATEEYYGKLMLGSLGGLALAEIAGGVYLAKRRRDASGKSAKASEIIRTDRHFPRIVGGVALAAVAGGLIVPAGLVITRPSQALPPNPDKMLAGLGFKDININIQGQGVVNTLVSTSKNYIKEVDQYYNQLAGTFRQNFEQRYGTKSLDQDPDTYRMIVADDFQGQDGPAQIVGLAAKMYNANLIVVGGDTTGTGKSFETAEFGGLRKYSGQIPILVSRGHHDPDLSTFQQMAKGFKGIYIADDKAQTIGGINIAGFNAPDIIPFGSDQDNVINPAFKGETPDQANARLSQQIIQQVCDSKKPLIVELHDDSVGHPLATAGCKNVKIVLDGREYVPKTPTDYGPTTEFTSGSTGGHRAYEPPPQLFSKITASASFRMVTIDKKTLEPIGSTLITLNPDGTVDIKDETITASAASQATKSSATNPSPTSSASVAESSLVSRRQSPHLVPLPELHKSRPTGRAWLPLLHQLALEPNR